MLTARIIALCAFCNLATAAGINFAQDDRRATIPTKEVTSDSLQSPSENQSRDLSAPTPPPAFSEADKTRRKRLAEDNERERLWNRANDQKSVEMRMNSFQGSHQSVRVRINPEPAPPSLDLYYKGEVIDAQGNIWDRYGGSTEKIRELKESTDGFVVNEGELPPGFREMDALTELDLLAAERAQQVLLSQSNTTNIFNDNRTTQNQFFETLSQTNSPSTVVINTDNPQTIINNPAPSETPSASQLAGGKTIINNSIDIASPSDAAGEFYESSVRPVIYRFLEALGVSEETKGEENKPALANTKKDTSKIGRSLASMTTFSHLSQPTITFDFSLVYVALGLLFGLILHFRKRVFIPLAFLRKQKSENVEAPSEPTFATSATKIKR